MKTQDIPQQQDIMRHMLLYIQFNIIPRLPHIPCPLAIIKVQYLSTPRVDKKRDLSSERAPLVAEVRVRENPLAAVPGICAGAPQREGQREVIGRVVGVFVHEGA